MPGAFTKAFNRAFQSGSSRDCIQTLTDYVQAHTATTPPPQWVEAHLRKLMVYLRRIAPCKQDQWVTCTDLPDDVLVVFGDVMVRVANNPRGYRSEQIGEYSYTLAGAGGVDGFGPFTGDEKHILEGVAGCTSSGNGLYSIALETPPILPLDDNQRGGLPAPVEKDRWFASPAINRPLNLP